MSTETKYDINYDDQRFKDVESEKKSAISENEQLYSGMIKDSDGYYQAQIDAAKDWEKKQTQLQNEQTDFAIEQINQQKDQAKKDYTKEQSGAYVDWQKQSDKQGVRAEQIADMGMQNTGYSESAQVSMYNTYQNRVMTARESYNNAVLNYNNAIKDARLQNSSALAEIAYKALQQQLELSLQGFQYKNQLLLDKANQKLQIEDSYYNRYQDVLNQINTENALAEQIRQFNESMALEREQFEWQKKKASGGGGSSGGGSRRSSTDNGNGDVLINTDSNGTATSSMSEETKKSILASGLGPVSQQGLANAVADGKVSVSTNKNGNTIVTKNTSLAASAAGAKPLATSSSSKTGVVQKVVNTIKSWFD